MTYRDLVEQRSKEWWNDSYNKKRHIHSKIHCNRYWSLEDFKEPTLLCCCPLWQRKFNHHVNSRTLAQLCHIPTFPLYWLGTDPRQIPLKSLHKDSRDFIIRPSYGHDRCCLHGPEEKLFKKFRSYQNKYSPRTVHFLVEPQYTECVQYHVHMFGGKIGLIQRCTGFRNNKFFQQKHMLYDENWHSLPLCEKQDTSYLTCFPLDSLSPPPSYLSKMLKYATQLGHIYDGYVKLSFRELEKEIYFYDMNSLHCLCSYYGRRKTCLSITCNAYFTSLWLLTTPHTNITSHWKQQQRRITIQPHYFQKSTTDQLKTGCSFPPPLPPGKLTRFSYYEYLILSSSSENDPEEEDYDLSGEEMSTPSFMTLISVVKESWNTKRHKRRRSSRFPKRVRKRRSSRYQGPIKIPSIWRPEENMMKGMSHHFPETI